MHLFMRKIFTMLLLAVAMMSTAQNATGFRNPVIPGFHPDPSVCRVGDDFYLVNSSFQYFPGVPIFHSRDLIHWRQIGNVLDRPSQIPLGQATSWQGIYAPTIRYNDGTYYMITTNVGNGGNFMVTATNPAGPWSEPIMLKQQGIDPSLYFENGKCYMVSNPDDAIWLCEINPKTGKQLTESRMLWQGTGGRYPEGPHLYKKDGYYYLLISEGGTEYGHSITIARSKKIEGPYQANPDNPILCHQRRITQTSQIQGTGHADLVQAADGSWWMVFLAFRTYGGNYHHLGRETFLAPVEWKKGQWPVVNGNGTVDTLMQVATLPQELAQPAVERIDFKTDKLGPEWIFIQNPVKDNYTLTDGRLRLTASASTLEENDHPTFIGRRQEAANMTVKTTVNVAGMPLGAEAGLTVYQINDGLYKLFARRAMIDGLRVTEVVQAYKVKGLENEDVIFTTSNPEVCLQIDSDGEFYDFSVSEGDTEDYVKGKRLDTVMLSSEVAGGFTGVVLGMYAAGANRAGYADFLYFDYQEYHP